MNSIRLLLAGCSLFLLTGCGKPAAAAPNAAGGAAPAAAPNAEMIAKLAKADAVDGKTDKVVSKCAGCALGMDGKADHAVKVGEYTLNLCDGCWAGGKADGMAMVAKLPAK